MRNKTVKNLTLVTVVALASAFAMAQAAESQAPVERMTGTVTCEAQVEHHYTCQRNQTQQTCTLACVEQGSKFVLMVGNTPYLLDGDRRVLEAYAGGKATVTGVAMNNQIEVQTASSAGHSMPSQGDALPSSMSVNSSNTRNEQ
jgi:hypothetical protein